MQLRNLNLPLKKMQFGLSHQLEKKEPGKQMASKLYYYY